MDRQTSSRGAPTARQVAHPHLLPQPLQRSQYLYHLLSEEVLGDLANLAVSVQVIEALPQLTRLTLGKHANHLWCFEGLTDGSTSGLGEGGGEHIPHTQRWLVSIPTVHTVRVRPIVVCTPEQQHTHSPAPVHVACRTVPADQLPTVQFVHQCEVALHHLGKGLVKLLQLVQSVLLHLLILICL